MSPRMTEGLILVGIMGVYLLGVAAGRYLPGPATAQAQCCGMLDVPLNTQIEIEYQHMGYGYSQAPPSRPDSAWIGADTPCKH